MNIVWTIVAVLAAAAVIALGGWALVWVLALAD